MCNVYMCVTKLKVKVYHTKIDHNKVNLTIEVQLCRLHMKKNTFM